MGLAERAWEAEARYADDLSSLNRCGMDPGPFRFSEERRLQASAYRARAAVARCLADPELPVEGFHALMRYVGAARSVPLARTVLDSTCGHADWEVRAFGYQAAELATSPSPRRAGLLWDRFVAGVGDVEPFVRVLALQALWPLHRGKHREATATLLWTLIERPGQPAQVRRKAVTLLERHRDRRSRRLFASLSEDPDDDVRQFVRRCADAAERRAPIVL